MSQLDLFAPLIQPETRKGASIEERFQAFHRANPQVYRAMRRMALDLKRRGFRRYSSDALMHALRWHAAIQLGPTDVYKFNDHFTSRFARLLMSDEPELAGFFETRRLRSRGVAA